LKIAFRAGAEKIEIDPQNTIEHDAQLARQFFSLLVRHLHRQVPEVEILNGLRIVSISGRSEKSVHARLWHPAASWVVGSDDFRRFWLGRFGRLSLGFRSDQLSKGRRRFTGLRQGRRGPPHDRESRNEDRQQSKPPPSARKMIV